MTYTFVCPLCKRVYQKDIKISEYDTEKDKQLCSDDKTKLERVIEFEGSIQGGGGGWFGKSNGGTTL